jgi:hypothetical protein
MRTHLTKAMRRAGVMLSGWLVASACSSNEIAAPVAPAQVAPPQAALYAPLADAIKSYFSATVLGRITALPSDISVSAKIGRAGGKIVVPNTGFELVIPEGALKSPVTISVTALAGKQVAFEFQPHGLNFKKAVRFRQNMWYTEGWWNTFGGGYFEDKSHIDGNTGTAMLAETMPATISPGAWIAFDIWHFSGYLVSCA